jgi:hypothetical protein
MRPAEPAPKLVKTTMGAKLKAASTEWKDRAQRYADYWKRQQLDAENTKVRRDPARWREFREATIRELMHPE